MSTERHHDAQEGQETPAPADVAAVPTVDAAAVLRDHRMSKAMRAGDTIVRFVCSVDYRSWRGDAETGGCEAVLLARRVALLERQLAKYADRTNWQAEPVESTIGLRVTRYTWALAIEPWAFADFALADGG